ncbi:MAG: DNA primase, partial [Oscillospiraceae bacterium]|nr:DNA primase [Oscillospiraceae bacterium]
ESGIVGIDIDHCISDGKLNETATAILAKLPPTYVEYSPSGSGLHIFLKGSLPKGGNRNSETGVEMYSTARYFTMTGNRYANCADEIADDDGVLAWIHSTYVKPKKPPKSQSATKFDPLETGLIPDAQILEMARKSKDGGAFEKLYSGNWQDKYKSQSEADFALCCKLAFWTAKDETQIDRLFRQSGLMREKWDTSNGDSTYGAMTVRNACGATSKTFKPTKKSAQKESDTSEIFEQNGCYYRNKGQKTYQLTNFKITPILMIEGEDESQLNCELVTLEGEMYNMKFKSSDFASLRQLKAVLSLRTIALSFFGGEGDLELFKQYLNGLGWTKKKGVKPLGICRHDGELVFVDSNGAVGVGGKKIDGIVQLDKHKIIESTILSAPFISKDGLILLGENILSYNEYSRTVPIIAWCAGCLIKPHLRRCKIKFPHMFHVGEKGGGKTSSMERVIFPFFGLKSATAASQHKAFTLMKESNSSNVIPQAIEEFKPSELPRSVLKVLRNHYRETYDCSKGTRGRPDQTQNSYDLLAPIIVCGEEDADEGAIRERAFELLFARRDLKCSNRRKSFEWIKANSRHISALGRSLLDVALATNPDEVLSWYCEGESHFSKEFPDRIVNNLCAVYAGICLLNKLCRSHGLAFADVFPIDNELCAKHLESAVREYLLDGSNFNKGAIEQAFEVMARMKLKHGEDYLFENNGQFLCLHLTGIYDRYTRYCKDYAVQGEVVKYALFRKQLEHTDFFVAKNRAKHFEGGTKKVWVIDFSILSKHCDVSGFTSDRADLKRGQDT